jgi:hypothetical protein
MDKNNIEILAGVTIMKVIDDTFERDEYTKFIYTNPNSISPELCKEIIQKFEASDKKYDGVTLGGVNKSVKDTKDLLLNTADWERISTTLRKELYWGLKVFMDDLSSKEDFKSEHNNTTTPGFKIKFDNISIDAFMAQRYTAKTGRYIYHNDSMVEWDNKRKRFMTYLWYLNDVVEGGETAFNGEYKIKPTAGKLILFPASWTFPHCGKMPVSSDKYIITGWIYTTTHS